MHNWSSWLAIHLARRPSASISFRYLLRCNGCENVVRATIWRGTVKSCYTGFCKQCNKPIMHPQGNTCSYCPARVDCIPWGRADLVNGPNAT